MDNSSQWTVQGAKTPGHSERTTQIHGTPEKVRQKQRVEKERRVETKCEGETGTPSNAGSVEDSSTSESSLSSKDATPPIVVMVVPGTGQRNNRARETNLQREKTDEKKSQVTGATRPAAQPQEEGDDGGELIDGEMIYVDDNGATVDSIITCSNTESADADHSDQEEPPLGQLSQTYTNGNEHTNNADD